jgi:hypothetical protein
MAGIIKRFTTAKNDRWIGHDGQNPMPQLREQVSDKLALLKFLESKLESKFMREMLADRSGK